MVGPADDVSSSRRRALLGLAALAILLLAVMSTGSLPTDSGAVLRPSDRVLDVAVSLFMVLMAFGLLPWVSVLPARRDVIAEAAAACRRRSLWACGAARDRRARPDVGRRQDGGDRRSRGAGAPARIRGAGGARGPAAGRRADRGRRPRADERLRFEVVGRPRLSAPSACSYRSARRASPAVSGPDQIARAMEAPGLGESPP